MERVEMRLFYFSHRMMALQSPVHLLPVRGTWNMVHGESTDSSYTLWNIEKTVFTYVLNCWLETCTMNYKHYFILFPSYS